MRLPYLIRFSKVLGSQLVLVGLLLPTLLRSQSSEQSLQYKVGDIARETIIATETIQVEAPANETTIKPTSIRKPVPYPLVKSTGCQSRISGRASPKD